MNKTTITIAIGALVASHIGLAETKIAPTASPAAETPTFLNQAKPSESTAATPVPLDLPIETEEQRDARMAWWRDARFGMFIHWGVFSVPAGVYKGETFSGPSEYLMGNAKIPVGEYKEFAKGFTASNYDADAIVRLAKQAGMKYIVITTKHHDGFAMFPSTASDWNITQTPYGKDILKPLVEACKKHGIKLGFYYSQAVDWINGGACSMDPDNKRTMDEYVDQIAVPQIRELLTNYGDAPAILWWDTPAGMNEERATKILELLKLKPGVIHNNRLFKMAGHMGVVDMQNLEAMKHDPLFGDTETPEQYIPPTGLGDRDFEVCMTMNDIWGYKKGDNSWKSTKVILHQLIDIASKGGNYLLNIGPKADGTIPEPSIERLQDIGKWMAVNSESIYGTHASPFPKLPWGRCTQKHGKDGTTLYLQVFDWPKNGELLVPGLENEVKSATLLANGEELEFEKTPSGVLIEVPDKALDSNATVIKVEIVGTPKVSKVFIKPGEHGSIELPAAMADFPAPAKGASPRLQEGETGNEIGFWENAEAALSWEFTGAKPGEYEVLAEISGIKDAKAIVEIGDQKLNPSISSTVNYNKYNTQSLGKIRIAGEGDQVIVIKPDPANWTAFNLRKVTLKPTAGQ
jgi:alpha-L-fucosidase